ncbi:MAG TPA: hypothetical protein VFG14_05560 [Chthoniobacteraceae bacterium]|nr:hypothetical protein [Chthoniobacteraceae bacterium]
MTDSDRLHCEIHQLWQREETLRRERDRLLEQANEANARYEALALELAALGVEVPSA